MEIGEQRNELAHLSRVTMLGELSGSLAHELNQPLTAILSNAQAAQRFLARDDVDLDEVRAILKDIVSDDKRAGEVIRGLRLLLTKGEMPHQRLDLNDVVRDTIRLVRSDLLNNAIDLDIELAPDLPMVSADRVQLQQVLLNLMVNGYEAMSDAAGAERKLVVRTARLKSVAYAYRWPTWATASHRRIWNVCSILFTTRCAASAWAGGLPHDYFAQGGHLGNNNTRAARAFTSRCLRIPL
jgi:two-component system sensor kinase FixL